MAKFKESAGEEFIRRPKNEFVNLIDSIDEVEAEINKLQQKLRTLHANLYSMLIMSETTERGGND